MTVLPTAVIVEDTRDFHVLKGGWYISMTNRERGNLTVTQARFGICDVTSMAHVIFSVDS